MKLVIDIKTERIKSLLKQYVVVTKNYLHENQAIYLFIKKVLHCLYRNKKKLEKNCLKQIKTYNK